MIIDENGAVEDVQFSGARAYSGAVIDVYQSLLKALKFTPARVGKRKVRSAAVVSVKHTFVEGPAAKKRKAAEP